MASPPVGLLVAERVADGNSPGMGPIGLAMLLLLITRALAVAADIAQAGVCAECHLTQTAALIETGGHTEVLDCQSCHADRRPGQVGNGHRSIPRCTTCHDTAGHPPRDQPRGRR